MLELKLGCFKPNMFLFSFSQSHHAGIETTIRKRIDDPGKLPIAPCWNWNGGYDSDWQGWWILPIAPCWNWNTEVQQIALQELILPIAPCWNWNYGGSTIAISKYPSPNRTMLELKPLRFQIVFCETGISQSHHAGIETTNLIDKSGMLQLLPIAPCWNWNITSNTKVDCKTSTPNRTMLELKRAKTWSRVNILLPSQSHHAGIETGNLWLIWVTPNISQSHHAGIETDSICRWGRFNRSPNRTMLELKQYSSSNLNNITWSSQSHHAGIETIL